LEADIGDDHDYKADGKYPRQPVAACSPKALGTDPTNKSMAAMSGAWFRRKVRHPRLGAPRRLTMYLATLDWATSNPSLSNSPWMRGAPQREFSTLIRRISARPWRAALKARVLILIGAVPWFSEPDAP
jgi:hypothetical protein